MITEKEIVALKQKAVEKKEEIIHAKGTSEELSKTIDNSMERIEAYGVPAREFRAKKIREGMSTCDSAMAVVEMAEKMIVELEEEAESLAEEIKKKLA